MNSIQMVSTDWGKFAVYSRPDGGADCISATISGNQFWDGALLLPFYDRWSSSRKLAIEIGAFNGMGAVYLSRRNKHVLAVEPVHHELLNRSLVANKCQNVTALRGAACSDGNAWFLPDPTKVEAFEDNPGGIALVKATTVEANEVECIQGFRLDTWVDAGEEVGLVKSDAQGMDLRALVGLKRTIERCRPAILFEFEEELAKLQGDSWATYKSFFEELNYELEEQDGVGYKGNFVALPR